MPSAPCSTCHRYCTRRLKQKKRDSHFSFSQSCLTSEIRPVVSHFLSPCPSSKCLQGRRIIVTIFTAGMVMENIAWIHSPPHLIMFHLVNMIWAFSILLPMLQTNCSWKGHKHKKSSTSVTGTWETKE